MKKFKWLMLGSLLFYVLVAVFLVKDAESERQREQHAYRVEINRVMEQLQTLEDVADANQRTLQYITSIQVLPASQLDESSQREFFLEENIEDIQIRPWYVEHELQGYLKFSYLRSGDHQKQILIQSELTLLGMELFLLGILTYLQHTLIRPLQELSELPKQLAQGHFKGQISIGKQTYLKPFLWGMSQLKDALDVSKKRQLELLKEKKQLLLSLSHDIKTPLHLIKLYAKALQEDVCQQEDSRQKAYAQIGDKVLQIEHYVDEIMRSSRDEILDLQVNNGEFYLSELIAQVLSIYQEQCALRAISLKVAPITNRLIKGDRERVQEIFENLFENAFKYGDGNRMELSFYEEDYCQLIRLYNTGTPVSDHEINHIFDSFFRAANSKGKQGSGLGLYICRELMKKMNGAIFVEKDAHGMAFVLVFH